MTYLIIVGWDANNHPVRTNIMETLEEADALVNKLINDMPEGLEAPDTFHVPDPEVDPSYIVVDPITKTITVDVVALEAEANAKAMAVLREKRNQLLHESDWWALNDLSISETQTSYRQALRDLPANTADPSSPVWPVKPV